MAQAQPPDPRAVQEEDGGAAGDATGPVGQASRPCDRYKIKLRSVGYRLVYEVRDEMLVVLVIAVGRRDHNEVYRKADRRQS